MCGIAGIFAPGMDAAELQSRVLAMVRAERFRGPDDFGLWSAEGVALGAARLSVTGGAVEGRQPIVDRWGGRTVFNGEIYSYRTVLRDLGEAVDGDLSDG